MRNILYEWQDAEISIFGCDSCHLHYKWHTPKTALLCAICAIHNSAEIGICWHFEPLLRGLDSGF